MSKQSYAAYRNWVKSFTSLDEKQVYKLWVGSTIDRNWSINQDPIIGNDGKYHFIYISVRNDGKIYVGKHSTYDMNDGYQGSGSEVKLSLESGYTFKTVPLCFCFTEDMAYLLEKMVVDESFLRESKSLVLNRTTGGKGYPNKVITPIIPKHTLQVQEHDSNSQVAIKSSYGLQTFKSKGIPIGSNIVYKYNENIIAKTIDDNNMVMYRGKVYTIYGLTKEVFEKFDCHRERKPNGYRYFTYNGVVIDKIK